ncbi:probable LRR receptor-like serine/threonine-protein kinase At3g47570 isoform X2 [Gossypium hirsutum]|uniref:Probable LRR receptor-like serine/threonine-protein kinase At3g47570 isoform X2 n=1 Tax=Gossypium hirsutum TaxID=3635 RepID=A0ABM2YWP6_GOSHI|nr:probable LRR receptor-like serine/threonine-protein kinase At3g47570 isoform X2 [Gossypium hirsutum]
MNKALSKTNQSHLRAMGISKKHLEVIILLSCFNLQGPNLLGLATATTVIRGNDTDQQALLHFKAKISGDRLKVMESWNSSIHFCQWHGITCGRKHQRVTKLELQVLELSGSLSPYIGNLSFLKELNLATNNFYDHIPQEVGHLRRLERLELINNSFSGEIPSNLSACSKLTYIRMRGNQLRGEIPGSFGLLSKLKFLSFVNNSLRGSIPPALGNLSSLEELYLTYNAFSGVLPEALGRLTNLTHFSADENSISGIIPTAMFNLSNIIVFSIGGNKIQGTLHSDLAITMPHVGAFSLWGNQIYGKIPISISNASNLYQLQLDENRLSGNVPSLEKLENLFVLNLYTNHLGHGIQGDLDFVCTLVNNTKLGILSIQNNNFGGVFPKCIRNFSRTFSVLGIEHNNILGRIPDGIGNLNNLEVLRASQNQLSGPIPFDIGRLKKLKKFYIDSNFLSGTIPHSIGNLTLLIELALDVNKLKGNIPSSLGDCQNLVRMTLSHNNLSGSIPPQVLALSSLSILLNLSSNYLTGELSAEVEKLKNLGELDVSKNRLSGLLPNNLGSCVSLEELFLDGNLFEGPIPSSLSSLRGLAALDVSENNLSGVIPSEGVFKNSSATFVEGNNKLCGGITELHLSRCNSEKSSNTSLRLKFVIVAVILGVTLIFLFLLIMLLRKKKEQQATTTCAENSLLRLSYQSILRATNGFSTQNLVGLGGFGSVYRGILEETGEVIAVKVLNLLNHGASRSFLAECEVLKNIRHRNLVKLLTAISGTDYQGNDFKALVYEFMVNGSLEDWLHPPAGTNEPKTIRNLNLFQRLNMAIDVAHALEYLHHHCEILIIHCDLKPSNILLDEEMVAHISDFGLAKILSADKLNYSASQSSSLGLRGTVGYAPPEYGMGSELSTKGDVYSYGILLLEMFTGKRPTDEIFEEGLSLHNFVKTTLPERMTEIIDPILLQEKVRQGTKKDIILSGNIIENDRCLQCMNSILEIGLTCCTELPSERVDMCDVVTELCSIRDQIYLTQLGGLC